MKDLFAKYNLVLLDRWTALPSPPLADEGLPVQTFRNENKLQPGQVAGIVDYEQNVIMISDQTLMNSDATVRGHFRKLWMATQLPAEVWADVDASGGAALEYLSRFEDGYFGVTVLDGEALWFYWGKDGAVVQDKRKGVLLYQAKVEIQNNALEAL